MSIYVCSVFVLSYVALRRADPRPRSLTDCLQDITVSELILEWETGQRGQSIKAEEEHAGYR
jgi:hypothetical protein